jgi:hypothetical protein
MYMAPVIGPVGMSGRTLAGLHCSDAELPISDAELPISDAELPISDAELPISDTELPISDAELPISDAELPIAMSGSAASGPFWPSGWASAFSPGGSPFISRHPLRPMAHRTGNGSQ